MSNKEKIYETIGVYFANCYWNNLYVKSEEAYISYENFESIDEAYLNVVNVYTRELCLVPDKREPENRHYYLMLRDIYENCRKYLNILDTFDGFIDSLVACMLPQENYYALGNNFTKKKEILHSLIKNTITNFTSYILVKQIYNITNLQIRKTHEKAVENIKLLKREFIDILRNQINKFCSFILAKNSGIDINNKDEIPSIPKKVALRLKQLFEQEKNKNKKLTKQYNQLVTYTQQLKTILYEKESNIKELELRVTDLQAERHVTNIKNIEVHPVEPEPEVELPLRALDDFMEEGEMLTSD